MAKNAGAGDRLIVVRDFRLQQPVTPTLPPNRRNQGRQHCHLPWRRRQGNHGEPSYTHCRQGTARKVEILVT